jgi:hypothetical protein
MSPLAGMVVFLAVPWAHVDPGRVDEVVTVNLVVGLLWAVPTWCAGITAAAGSVRLNFYGAWVRRVAWEDIAGACVAWRGVEPQLRLDLVDGTSLWAPGFQMPLSQRSSRQDGWRSTEMFRAARLISAEAERRRRQPPPAGTREWVRAPALAHAAG